MRKIVLQILVLLILGISIQAQSQEEEFYLIDEFEIISREDIYARLGNLAITLSNNPTEKAHIKIYGGIENYFARPYFRGSRIIAYLRNNAKLPSERYSIEYCNVNKEGLRTQFFMAAANASIPKCKENLEIPDKTVLFDTTYFHFPEINFVPIEDLSLYSNGPSEGEYSKTAQNVLKKLLEKSTQSKVYLIAYLGTNLHGTGVENEKGEWIIEDVRNIDKKSVGKKMTRIVKKEMIKNGIDTNQIKIINGGYVEGEKRIEFWFVPKGGEIPKPKPDYFPKRSN